MEIVGNVNHAGSIFGYFIFDSNYKTAHMLTLGSLNLKFSPFLGEEMFSMVETVLNTFRYIKNIVMLNISD